MLFSEKAVMFDPNEYQGMGWYNDFVAAAIEECYDFIPDDWYIKQVDGAEKKIYVQRHKYDDKDPFAPAWLFEFLSDPTDDDDNQWIVFNVSIIDTPTKYPFKY
jgi:hypothetical protein